MKVLCISFIAGLVWIASFAAIIRQGGKSETVSFKSQVFPIIRRNCLPCHAEDNFNPSELSLDGYESLMQGGKHGTPIVAGKAKESILVQKLSPTPPFGDRMPLNLKGKKEGTPQKVLSEEDMQTIMEWINQGAKDN